MLEQFADGLWETCNRIRFMGVGMPARMLAIRLGDGGVLVHSPSRFTDDLRQAVDAIGPVRGLIAPNNFHHLFMNDWREAYPEATMFVAPSLTKKRKDLDDGETLTDEAPALWADEMDQVVWGGIPKLAEVAFFHRPSGTLINTDMMHNLRHDPSWLTRVAWKSLGAYGRFGPSKLERRWTKDSAALRESIDRILEWDFRRVTVAHGDILEADDARDQVAESWSWVDTLSR